MAADPHDLSSSVDAEGEAVGFAGECSDISDSPVLPVPACLLLWVLQRTTGHTWCASVLRLPKTAPVLRDKPNASYNMISLRQQNQAISLASQGLPPL